MAISSQQLLRLLDKLIDRTSTASIAWEPTFSGSAYQARFQDFIVSVDSSGTGLLGGIQFVVKKLDGSVLVTSSSGMIVTSGHTIPAVGAVLERLRRLYDLIDNSSDEFEKLMSLI